MEKLRGPKGQLYADPQPTPDATSFHATNNSSAYYNSPYYLAHKNLVQPIPPRNNDLPLDLKDFLPADLMAGLTQAKRISFHTVGDTGAAKVNRSQTAATAIGHEGTVADAMVKDLDQPGAAAPAFYFNLGDVIYNFGEEQYYYDQFYEPYREYDRPIFAIPGNHDGMVFGMSSGGTPQVPSLQGFLRNFCAAKLGPAPDAAGLARSLMVQPGVYFTLDAPFVSIIGLYSNVLDAGPGVISSQGGRFPIGNQQLDFLRAELSRLKPARQSGERAVLLAVHHPPLSVDARHGGSSGLEQDIDACCQAVGLWPDMVLSGHAHLYQRFTRKQPNGQQTPYITAGCGGFAATPSMSKTPKAPTTLGDVTLEIDPIVDFGYVTVTVDNQAQTLSLAFRTADAHGVQVRDSLTLDLKAGKLKSGSGKAGRSAPAAKRKPAKQARRAKPATSRNQKKKRRR